MIQYQEVGHVEVGKSKGRGKKLDDDQVNEILEFAHTNNFLTYEDITDHFVNQGYPNFSAISASRYLKEKGISNRIASEKPNLTSQTMSMRMSLANLNSTIPIETLRKTIFIDEFSIDTRSKAQKFVKRFKGPRYNPRNINRYELRNPKSVSFVCCFSYDRVVPIMQTEGRFTAVKYLDYLENHLIPFGMQHYGLDFYLLHDNCPIHRARIVQDFLDSFMPDRVLKHPAYSPDLNPIEHLGSFLKKSSKDAKKSRA